MAQVFGEFLEILPTDYDSLEISFTPTSRPIKRRWRNNRLSAHFVADYLSAFLPVDEDTLQGEERIKQSKETVSYLANELLENAIKFNNHATKFRVRFGIHFVENIEVKAVIFTVNSINPDGIDKFQSFIQELLVSDADELYISQIEKSAESTDSEASGLGFLTMMSHYSAKLGWKFETIPGNPQVMTVTTMAQITV